MEPVAGGPADDAPGKEVNDDGKIEPALACPDIGDVGAPFLVRPRCVEVLIEEVWRDRKGVQAVGRSFEAPPLPCLQGILPHQSGDPMTTDGDPVIAKLARHARAAVGCVRQCKGRANMGQQHHVLMLSTAGRSILPGKIAALADAKNLAETLDGEFLLRRIDETEPHRLPSLAKKVAALFRISRSCRKISFSRRNRFSSAARSSCRSGGGASISCSRRLSSQRRSVERPTPRSIAISLCVRPLTSTNRTASASNSFPNRRCGLPMKCSSFLQKSSPLSQGKSNYEFARAKSRATLALRIVDRLAIAKAQSFS